MCQGLGLVVVREVEDGKIYNAKVVKVGTEIVFSDKLKATCLEVKDEGIRILKFEAKGIFLEVLEEIGIRKELLKKPKGWSQT